MVRKKGRLGALHHSSKREGRALVWAGAVDELNNRVRHPSVCLLDRKESCSVLAYLSYSGEKAEVRSV